MSQFLTDSLIDSKIISFLKKLQEKQFLPNLIFEGPPGTGKTTTAREIISSFFSTPLQYLELNSSSDRGIGTIRDYVIPFSQGRPIQGSLRLVLFEEAQNLTKDAQAALRNTMEAESSSCRYIFTCNSNTLDPAIKSRCVNIPFKIDLAKLSDKTGIDITTLNTAPDLRFSNRILQSNLNTSNELLSVFYSQLIQENSPILEETYTKLQQKLPTLEEIRKQYVIVANPNYSSIVKKLIDIFLDFQYSLFICKGEEYIPIHNLLYKLKAIPNSGK